MNFNICVNCEAINNLKRTVCRRCCKSVTVKENIMKTIIDKQVEKYLEIQRKLPPKTTLKGGNVEVTLNPSNTVQPISINAGGDKVYIFKKDVEFVAFSLLDCLYGEEISQSVKKIIESKCGAYE